MKVKLILKNETGSVNETGSEMKPDVMYYDIKRVNIALQLILILKNETGSEMKPEVMCYD